MAKPAAAFVVALIDCVLHPFVVLFSSPRLACGKGSQDNQAAYL
jgi:hypothetical protein